VWELAHCAAILRVDQERSAVVPLPPRGLGRPAERTIDKPDRGPSSRGFRVASHGRLPPRFKELVGAAWSQTATRGGISRRLVGAFRLLPMIHFFASWICIIRLRVI